MATFLGQLSYFSSKTTTDLIAGSFITALNENAFFMIQNVMTKDVFFGFLGLSEETNAHLVRLLRLLIEPIFLMTLLNMTETMFLGDSDITGGPFLTLVVVAMASGTQGYINQLQLFFKDLSNIVFDQLSQNS